MLCWVAYLTCFGSGKLVGERRKICKEEATINCIREPSCLYFPGDGARYRSQRTRAKRMPSNGPLPDAGQPTISVQTGRSHNPNTTARLPMSIDDSETPEVKTSATKTILSGQMPIARMDTPPNAMPVPTTLPSRPIIPQAERSREDLIARRSQARDIKMISERCPTAILGSNKSTILFNSDKHSPGFPRSLKHNDRLIGTTTAPTVVVRHSLDPTAIKNVNNENPFPTKNGRSISTTTKAKTSSPSGHAGPRQVSLPTGTPTSTASGSSLPKPLRRRVSFTLKEAPPSTYSPGHRSHCLRKGILKHQSP